ncbi:MAG: rod shape-determining protein MreC [Acidobacteriota bacterium]|jgi:rod shape-determining protein MreC|nr:rod shape-determining protein MreC [Acidobacteriota bacterium]
MPVQRTQKEIRRRAPMWLVLMLATNAVLMSVSAQDQQTHERKIRVWAQMVATPFQSFFSGASRSGVGFFQYISNLNHAASENEQLKRQLADVEAELRVAKVAREENERLQGLLNLKEAGDYQIVAARVIARDPSDWFDSAIINRGSSSGIAPNMPVVTPEGIVGRVSEVSPVSAQVMMITDERAAEGAVVGQLETSNALGSVRGFGKSGLLEMKYVPGLEAVNPGDSVTTTGQDGIYPRGLKVGDVIEVQPGTATRAHEIKVRPSARLNSLSEVAVLLYHPPPRAVPTPSAPPQKNTRGK